MACRIAGDLGQIAVGVTAVMRRHRAERTGLGDGASGDLNATCAEVLADLIGAEVGGEAQVKRARGVDGAGLPVRRAAGTHDDLLVGEHERYAVVAEYFAAHAEHPAVPVDGGVDVTTVEHDVVDSVHSEGHTSRYCQELWPLPSCCSTAPACGFAPISVCRRRSRRPTDGRSTRCAAS